jgi:hypothetical protein
MAFQHEQFVFEIKPQKRTFLGISVPLVDFYSQQFKPKTKEFVFIIHFFHSGNVQK